MAAETQPKVPILEVAWTRYGQLDEYSSVRSRPHARLRRWIAVLGVLATFFAVLTTVLGTVMPEKSLGGVILKTLLVLTPILGSVLAAFVGKFYGGGDWLVSRAGAEEIQKEIYYFRTILKHEPDRRARLERRMTAIQRQVYRGMSGEMVLKKYTGKTPPYYYPDDPNSDPGFSDLTGDEYFLYRVESQLAWHIKKVNQFQMERTRLQLYILLAGGASAMLAAWGGSLSIWVAVTAALAATFIGWQELKNYDPLVKNYSKVIVELMIIYDHWKMLEPAERTESEFFSMVKQTEDILWSQNVEYIKSMQEALAGAELEEAELVNNVLKKAVETDKEFKRSMTETLTKAASESMDQAREEIEETFEKAVGSLAEEASSELVQQELEAMGRAAAEAAQAVAKQFKNVNHAIEEVAKEFAGIPIGTQTPKNVLNKMISRYPPSGEVKG